MADSELSQLRSQLRERQSEVELVRAQLRESQNQLQATREQLAYNWSALLAYDNLAYHKPRSASFKCHQAVVSPIDVHPFRSPQVVQSALLKHMRGKHIVEFGTRNGDGMCCFALAAKSATAVEFNREYCTILQHRSDSLQRTTGRSFRVECARYQKVALDRADVLTWWFGGNGLDSAALLHLRERHDAGGLKPNASAIVLFEAGTADDDASFKALQSFAAWREEVPFDEAAMCSWKYFRKPWLCTRSKGSYHVAGFRIADVPLTVRDQDPRAKTDAKTFAKREAAVG